MANPTWRAAHDVIKTGKIGHVAQAQTSYYRNSAMGQWRYYKLTKDMTPKTVDWDMDSRSSPVSPWDRRFRSTAPSMASGAATGPSAAACSPTSSFTKRRT